MIMSKNKKQTTCEPVDVMVKRLIDSSSDDDRVDKHLFRCAVFCLAATLLHDLVGDPRTPAPEELQRLNSQSTDFAWAARKALLKMRTGAR